MRKQTKTEKKEKQMKLKSDLDKQAVYILSRMKKLIAFHDRVSDVRLRLDSAVLVHLCFEVLLRLGYTFFYRGSRLALRRFGGSVICEV